VKHMAKLASAVRRALNLYGSDRHYIWYLYHNL
jgi:hypothetical protein